MSVKKELDVWLDEVDYAHLNSPEYLPSEFALMFMNFIKLVNGEQGEANKTPPVHLSMLDKIVASNDYIANLCFRGAAKTTVFMEYLTLFLAVFHNLPGLGDVDGMIYVSDSMDNGVKSARKNIEFRYYNSEFLQLWIPEAKFTDNYLEFRNKNGEQFGVKMFGAKALALDTLLFTETGITTIGACAVGDVIYGPDGQLTRITKKSEVFHKPMYEIRLKDGRSLRASEDHLNQVWVKTFQSNLANPPLWEEKTLSTSELLAMPLYKQQTRKADRHSKGYVTERPLVWVENTQALAYPKKDFPVDPYVVGLLLGDGALAPKAKGKSGVRLVGHKDDWMTYRNEIPYPLGKIQIDNRNANVITHTLLGMQNAIDALGMNCHGDFKEIPYTYFFGSIPQRQALLQGLMDTDGTVTLQGKTSFTSNSKRLCDGVASLVRSLGGSASVRKCSAKAFQVHIRLNMPMFRLARKLDRQRYNKSNLVAIDSINRIADEPSQCIAVDNEDRQFLTDDYFRTHNTGIRGTKIFGKRPVIAVLDDLVSDDDAKSPAAMIAIKDTVYKGVNHAMDPTRRKIIFNGTPFNKDDILIEAVESGGWAVNVWPVCEKFPCTREEFKSAWPDRFTYDYIKSQYDLALATGKLASFYQELMLRISSEEERLIQDAEVRWYSRVKLLSLRGNYNFYITTDFATSKKKTADYSVISVWAYNANGDWFWVDGVCARQTIDITINDLFRLVQEYQPQSVGIEVTGQQGAFIQWLQQEQMSRNVWFNFASSEKNNAPGIRPVEDKLSRLNLVVPWFKAGKMYFPEEMKASTIMGIFMQQIRLATVNGLKGKDDALDTISMLAFIRAWKPSGSVILEESSKHTNDFWDLGFEAEERTRISSYIV